MRREKRNGIEGLVGCEKYEREEEGKLYWSEGERREKDEKKTAKESEKQNVRQRRIIKMNL